VNPYVLLAAGGFWAITTVGAYQSGRTRGIESERLVWQTRENLQLQAANQKIRELAEQAREAERTHAEANAAISDYFQGELQNEKKRHDADLAAVRDGGFRLRDRYSAAICPGPDRVPETAAPAERHHGAEGAELSRESTIFLLGLASEADQIVMQLQACQAVIAADRVTAAD